MDPATLRGGGATPPDGLAEVLDRLHRAARAGQHLGAITSARIAVFLGLDALTIDAITGDRTLELVWCDPTDGLGPDLDNLQYTLGDGPTLEAARLGCLVIEPDLVTTDPFRWPLFLPAVMHSPVRAVFATPLRLGVATVGALTGYRTSPGTLTTTQLRDFHRVRRGLLPLLLHSAPSLSNADSSQGDGLHLYRAEVHQAAGFLSSKLAIPLDQALALLRAHALRHNLPLIDLARDTLAHRLQLDDHSP